PIHFRRPKLGPMGDTGLEPVTSSMSTRRASQLRQSPGLSLRSPRAGSGAKVYRPAGLSPAGRWILVTAAAGRALRRRPVAGIHQGISLIPNLPEASQD